jgi:RNA polymerase sigma-70 factor (ECF subfamily)
LREDEREVLMLTAWEDLSSKEAAAVLKCSPTAYRIRLHRARLRLRAALSALEATEPLVHNFVRPNIEESSSC